MKFSICIVTWKGKTHLEKLIQSIFEKTETDDYEVIVIDNGSQDGSRYYLYGRPDIDIVVFNSYNLGITKAMNQAYKLATGDYIVRMDNDTIVKTKNWLTKMEQVFKHHKDCGMVFPTSDGANHMINAIRDIRRVPNCPFFCVMFRKKLIDEIGDCDENFGLVYGDDEDYILRMKLETGLECYCDGEVRVNHVHKKGFDEKSREYFDSKWGDKKEALDLLEWK